MLVALAALFVSLGGAGWAATGDNFILGKANTADATSALTANVPGADVLRVANLDATAGSAGLRIDVASGHAPIRINSSAGRAPNLNADKLDSLNSTDFLRNTAPLSLTGSTSTGGVITGKNTGNANGVQGESSSPAASGVYGQNSTGGYGVAGRSGNGVGVYGESLGGPNAHGVSALSDGPDGTVLATNNGLGPALELHSNGPPMRVDSPAKVDNLNADKVDGLDSSELVVGDPARGGGRLIARRETSLVSGVLLVIPGMGNLRVDTCDNSTARLAFDTAGTGPVDSMFSAVYDTGTEQYSIIGNYITTLTRARGFVTWNIARNTFESTKIATIWVSWYAVGCRFQAQALESPQL